MTILLRRINKDNITRFTAHAAAYFIFTLYMIFFVTSLNAREIIKIDKNDIALDISQAVEIYETPEDHISVSTSPGADKVIRREEVQATHQEPKNSSYHWAVFAVTNSSNEQLDRLIVIPHYRLIDSGILHPDLGKSRIYSITPSSGFTLNRKENQNADIFSLTINPNEVVTLVAQISSAKIPPLYVWESDSYKDTQNSYTLYHGILLGISVLIALCLAVLFLVRGTFVFPAAALLAWASVAYIGLDFHFINKLINISCDIEPIWRASIEVILDLALIIFLTAYLNIYHWHYKLIYAVICYILSVLLALFFAISHPILASSIARIILIIIAIGGSFLITYLSFKRFEHAIMIVPTWLVLILWIVSRYACMLNLIDNDIIEPALNGGLILIILLIAFTILKDVFSSSTFHQGIFTDSEKRSLAVLGSGDIIWAWDVTRDKLEITPDLECYLGATAKKLSGSIKNFADSLHLEDRDLFFAELEIILDNKQGQLKQNLRMRASDNHYHWFALRARPVLDKEGEITSCMGTLRNINEYKEVQEQILKDSVHDSLTGLPNREIFLDRLQHLLVLSQNNTNFRPTILIIDFDGFRSINQNYGYNIGNRFLNIMAKRFTRLLRPQDSLTHLKADRFAAILMSSQKSSIIAELIDAIQKAATSAVRLDDVDIKLNNSIGIYNLRNNNYNAQEILNNAQIALAKAKRQGGNSIELFKPELRHHTTSLSSLTYDLPRALKANELQIIYHPILSFDNSEVVGFESYCIWNHPQYETISVSDLICCAENTKFPKLIAEFTFETIAQDLLRLEEQFKDREFFIAMNLNSCEMLQQNIIDQFQSIYLRYSFKAQSFILEISENVISQKPEQSATLLNKIKDLGFGLTLDNFGGVGSSIAYLTDYPFDMVKFDKIILYEKNKQRGKLLKSTINIAHSLGYKTIAVGVDTEERAKWLAHLGCDYVQSIKFTEPSDIESLIKWMKFSKDKK